MLYIQLEVLVLSNLSLGTQHISLRLKSMGFIFTYYDLTHNYVMAFACQIKPFIIYAFLHGVTSNALNTGTTLLTMLNMNV